MTITYPRSLPDGVGWVPGTRFNIVRVQDRAPTRGGKQQVVGTGRDYWTMEFFTKMLREPASMAFDAWLDSLRGGARLFHAWHPLREYPQSYSGGFSGLTVAGTSDPFPGYGNLDDVGANLDTIDVSELPDGFLLKAGDMLSFQYSGTSALHRIIEDATASSFGIVTLNVEPTVAISYETDVQVSFYRPSCLAVLDEKSIQRILSVGRKGSFQFRADQVHT